MTRGILTFLKSEFVFCYEYIATTAVLCTLYCICAESFTCLGDHLRSWVLDALGEPQAFLSTGNPWSNAYSKLVNPCGTQQHKFKIVYPRGRKASVPSVQHNAFIYQGKPSKLLG